MAFRRFLLFVSILCIYPLSLLAQSRPALSEDSKDDLRTTTNAIAALAGDDSLSAGRYKFKNDTSPDVDLNLYKFVGEIPLGDSEDQFLPLLEISPGYLKLEQNLREGDITASAEADSWSLGAGAGLQMQFFNEQLEIIPRFKVGYSEINYDISISGVDNQVIAEVVPDIRAWTYIPSLEGNFSQQVTDGGAQVILNSQLSWVYVDALASGDDLPDFSDESWVTRNLIGYEQPVSLGEKLKEIFIRPNIGRVEIHGAARNGFGFEHFYEFGMDLLSRSVADKHFKEIGFGGTYIYEKEIQGWRFGLFGKLA